MCSVRVPLLNGCKHCPRHAYMSPSIKKCAQQTRLFANTLVLTRAGTMQYRLISIEIISYLWWAEGNGIIRLSLNVHCGVQMCFAVNLGLQYVDCLIHCGANSHNSCTILACDTSVQSHSYIREWYISMCILVLSMKIRLLEISVFTQSEYYLLVALNVNYF